MRYVTMGDAKPGMVLAYDLFDSFGRILIGSDAILTETYISKLMKMGFSGIYIRDEISSGIEIDSIISPELRAKGCKNVREQNIDGCKETSSEIVNEVLSKGTLALDLSDLKSFDDYTYAHSVNVAVLASVIGFGLGLQHEDLENLVLAGLLHDLGKMAIPSEIINKPGRLTADEYQIMQSHTTLAYDMLKPRIELSAQVKQAVLYHHENEDGSGYPHGVDSTELSLYAQILHVADVYDGLVSNRPYKKPYSPYEASEYLMGGCGTMFNKKIVEAFLKYVPLYPKGTTVQMSDGRLAIICDNTNHHNLRPILRLMDGTNLDLEDEENLNITIRSVDENSVEVIEAYENERAKMIVNGKRFKIILVDYDESHLARLRQTLCAQYDVVTLKSYGQTMIYLEHNEFPDLIIMEVDMPGKDGVQLSDKIRQKTKYTVPIIFVTSKSDRDTVLACRKMGAASYILKPYQPTFLRSEVKRVLTGICDTE